MEQSEEVRRIAQVERGLSVGVDQCVLSWFGHLERMDEQRMAEKVMNFDAGGDHV